MQRSALSADLEAGVARAETQGAFVEGGRQSPDKEDGGRFEPCDQGGRQNTAPEKLGIVARINNAIKLGGDGPPGERHRRVVAVSNNISHQE